MITPEQLARALDRIHPRDRELLSLSLHRRVPDEALARLYECEPGEVARRRAGAIERLADEMDVQRGENLGAVLEALLAPQTWRALPAGVGEEFAAEAPDPPRRAVRLALVGLGIAALVGAAGLIGATQFGGTDRVVEAAGGGGGGGDTRHFIPAERGPRAAPFAGEPRILPCYSTAYLPRPTVLYREPGGRGRMRITAKTEWGSPRVLGVIEQRRGWLGVQAAELANGEVAWVRRERARMDCVSWSLHADLSKRTLFVRRDGRTIRKMRVAIGRSTNPTPQGRFSVTDKLRVTDPGSPYGCCVLALTGHQTNLPVGWPGGDRLAVHATSDQSSIGERASLGCLRTHAFRARWLIETVPLGTPIFIRA